MPNSDGDMAMRGVWKQKSRGINVWWLVGTGQKWKIVFSFDRKKQYILYRDYPYKLTAEEKAIFDAEEPFWANYFRDRQL